MGGCYSGSYGHRSSCEPTQENWEKDIKKAANGFELENIIKAYKSYFQTKNNGFIGKLAQAAGINKVTDIPKEFPEIEYEVKFDIQASGEGEEPSIKQYLNAFDYPVGASARFIKDPINTSAVGVNHFFGDSLDERLVVIEKGGKLFLKEKGLVEPTNLGIPYENIVIKRKETRYEAAIDDILDKISEITQNEGTKYRGKIRKEKGDDFLLDTNDGRIYSFTITRAHLTKASSKEETGTQRQLEIEYAGYIPGFPGFKENSEKQIVKGMIDVAKYTWALYGTETPIGKGWNMNLAVTAERKYDFVIGAEKKQIGLGRIVLPYSKSRKQVEARLIEDPSRK